MELAEEGDFGKLDSMAQDGFGHGRHSTPSVRFWLVSIVLRFLLFVFFCESGSASSARHEPLDDLLIVADFDAVGEDAKVFAESAVRPAWENFRGLAPSTSCLWRGLILGSNGKGLYEAVALAGEGFTVLANMDAVRGFPAAEAAGFPGNVEQAIGSVLGPKVLVAL